MSGRRYAVGERHLRWDIPLAIGALRRRDVMWKDALVLSLALQDLKLVEISGKATLFRSQYPSGRNRLGNWLLDKILARQRGDKSHHAPACAANRWSGMALAIQPCTCRAWKADGVWKAMNTEGSAAL